MCVCIRKIVEWPCEHFTVVRCWLLPRLLCWLPLLCFNANFVATQPLTWLRMQKYIFSEQIWVSCFIHNPYKHMPHTNVCVVCIRILYAYMLLDVQVSGSWLLGKAPATMQPVLCIYIYDIFKWFVGIFAFENHKCKFWPLSSYHMYRYISVYVYYTHTIGFLHAKRSIC